MVRQRKEYFLKIQNFVNTENAEHLETFIKQFSDQIRDSYFYLRLYECAANREKETNKNEWEDIAEAINNYVVNTKQDIIDQHQYCNENYIAVKDENVDTAAIRANDRNNDGGDGRRNGHPMQGNCYRRRQPLRYIG